jgi:hypothetical protein
MKKFTFKITQADGTILIYKPRQDYDAYSVTHYNPKTESARLIRQIPTTEAFKLFEQYKVQKDVTVAIK